MGASTGPSSTRLLVTNIVDYSMDLQQAIDFPRFLWDGRDGVLVEEGFSELDRRRLRHEVIGYPGATGVAQGVEVMEDCVKGVCDVRGEGLPAGF